MPTILSGRPGQPGGQGGGELGPAANTQLAVGPGERGLDGLDTQEERRGDLPVARPARGQTRQVNR
jgi:hypothetical protein